MLTWAVMGDDDRFHTKWQANEHQSEGGSHQEVTNLRVSTSFVASWAVHHILRAAEVVVEIQIYKEQSARPRNCKCCRLFSTKKVT